MPEVSAEVYAIGRSGRGDMSAMPRGPMSRAHPGSRHHAKLNRKQWELLRLRIFERDNWRCVRCGKAGRLECDHVVPLDKGGAPYDPANLQSLCRTDHISKSRIDAGHGPDTAREAWQTLVAEISNS